MFAVNISVMFLDLKAVLTVPDAAGNVGVLRRFLNHDAALQPELQHCRQNGQLEASVVLGTHRN